MRTVKHSIRKTHKHWGKTIIIPAAVSLVLILLSAQGTGSLLDAFGTHAAEIGVEHAQPLSLSLQVGVKDESAVIEFLSSSQEQIFISVPSDWQRREVRNAPIDSVTADPPSLGFTRWKVPSGAGISFNVVNSPSSAIMHNPSGSPLKLDLAFVDLGTGVTEREVVLIHEETVTLW